MPCTWLQNGANMSKERVKWKWYMMRFGHNHEVRWLTICIALVLGWDNFHALYVFRCVRQERISLRGSVRPSVIQSVRPSVHPPARPSVCSSVRPSVHPPARPSVCSTVRLSVRDTCAKTAFLGCFWPRWDPLVYWMINKRFWEPPLLLSCFICLFVHLSLHMSHMFSAKLNTRRDTVRTRIVARLGLFYLHLERS